MSPYDIAMKCLREAGFDHDGIADVFSRDSTGPVYVVNVVRNQDGKISLIRHLPGHTLVVFQGLQMTMDRLTLLIELDIARDWGLTKRGET